MHGLIILCLLLIYNLSYAGQTRIQGKIIDKYSSAGVGYANLRVENSTKVTTANADGFFEIDITPGIEKVIISRVGYDTDTLLATNGDFQKNNYVFLCPSAKCSAFIQNLSQVDSASDIIKKTIKANEEESSCLHNYEFEAYNKCVVRENNKVGFGTGSFRLDFDEVKESVNLIKNLGDSTVMNINGIYEYISKGYYANPDDYREIIEAKKTRSNLPPSLNDLMGTKRIQNLYSAELRFYNRPVPGPFSPNTLDYYSFILKDKMMMDDHIIYKLFFEPKDENDPGLIGFVYIRDGDYRLVKIEADLNRVVDTGGNFERVTIIQQFIPVKDGNYLPADYRMIVSSSYLGIAKIEYDLTSVISDYKINQDVQDYSSGKVVFAVAPDAEKKDSTYWRMHQSVPFTEEEFKAYEVIDSMRSAPKSFIYGMAGIFAPQYRLNENISISGPFGIYQFNHVEGHTLYFTTSVVNLLEKKLDARITLSNGFSDKKFKEKISTAYYPDEDRRIKITFDAYNQLATMFSSSDPYSSLTSTVLSLFSKHDFRSYYYAKGFDLGIDAEIFHFLSLNAAYSNQTDNTAYTTTTFSLFGIGKNNFSRNSSNSTLADSVNPPIYEARINTLSFGFNFDFRNYVSENNLRKRVSEGSSFASFGAGVIISDPKWLKSSIGFVSYNFNILGELNTFNTASLGFKITGIYSDGPVPFQMQYALPGNISATGRSYTFRTIGVSNMFGDQALTLTLEHNFREETYRILPIYFLRNLRLNTFFNVAWKNMSPKSAAIMPVAFTTLKNPLFEAGFSIGYASIPASLEFAFRLSHFDKSNFRFGINTSIL